MEIGTERIRPNNVCVRAFDGVKRDIIGEIDLILTIGPVDFEVTFQVLDMDTSYNFLLSSPWIHAAGAVPSTLHQMVKLEHEDQEIVVHGEYEQSIYWDPSVPCLEAKEGSKHIVYQAFEIVVADKCEEGTPCPQPFLSNASIMVVSEMSRHGYKPGKGLGASLQGITEPITLTTSENFFGVGFQATEADAKWAKECKSDGYNNANLNNMTYLWTSCPDPNTLSDCEIMNQEPEYDEDETFREINQELEKFENDPKPNSNETEPINLGSSEEVQETMISIHIDERTRDALIQLLFEFKVVFDWSYDEMLGLSVDLVVHKFPTYPDHPPVQQKQRTFKTNISDKMKEEVTKQLKAGVIQVVRYTTWLDNMVLVPKKDGKTQVCVDYRDLNKASPKDTFPLPNIHIFVDNCAKHEIQSFVDCYARYNQVLTDEDNAKRWLSPPRWVLIVTGSCLLV
ncbi:uncharacterized protein [Nicotiana sylvestris]|uniref:uncharacterized protein n=1 Tax=Nicotiana sylvestris TaxID=4096 RepID=UPI00388CB09B